MLAMLRGFTLFTFAISAAAAFIANGVYRITNDKGNTVLRADVYDWDCYLGNFTTGGSTDLYELWLVNANPFDDVATYTFLNLAQQAYATLTEKHALHLEQYFENEFGIVPLSDGSYSIRTIADKGPGPKAWAAQPPLSRGSIKLVDYTEGRISQKWRFESMLRDA